MRNYLIAAVLFGLVGATRPGEPTATLTGKSVSGRTTFTAELPSCSYLEKAELTIDGSKLTFLPSDKSYIIFEPENQVLTIFLETQSSDPAHYKFLKCWAIPSTFKKTRNEKGVGSEFHDTYEFHAKLYATEPRKTGEPNTKTIELVCTLDYEL